MLTIYRVKRINLKGCHDTKEYWNRVFHAQEHYCKGMKELIEYCGGKLHRSRTGGYCGMNGDIEYVAEVFGKGCKA